MRIGIDILSEIAGQASGTETYLQGFLKALAEVDAFQDEIFLFVNSSNQDFYNVRRAGFRQVRFPFSAQHKPLRVLSQLILIPYYARRLELDVVNFLGTTGAFAVGCATVQHVKTLHHIQYPNTVATFSAIFRRLMMGPSARAADIVIANSRSTKEGIIKHLGVDSKRVVVVPEAVDHTIFFPKRHGDSYRHTLRKYGVTEPYLLFVSSLWPYKNVHGLIRAFSNLVHRYRVPHDLVIVGGLSAKGYQTKLLQLVNACRLDRRVHFVGHVADRHEIRDFYVGADVYIYPSYAETFGLTLLESMACGTPVVASNRTSIPEVAGDASLLVDPDNQEGIAEAIWKVLSDKELRESLITKGLQRARQFTWERTARETLRAYELALEFRRGYHGS